MGEAGKDHSNVIAPPPLLFLGMLLVALGIDYALGGPATGLAPEARFGLAALLGVGALALLAGALTRFRAAGTKPEPWLPASAVVTGGVYRFTRNPMYLGMTLAYLALALALDSVVALVAVAPLLVIVQFGVIAREERYMAARFGDDYLAYKARVRRWL